MSVSSVQSGYALINQSQSLSREAANDIAQNTKEARPSNTSDTKESTTSAARESGYEFNKVEEKPEAKEAEQTSKKQEAASYQEALVKLNQADTYNQAGANVVQKSNEIIGTLLDTRV